MISKLTTGVRDQKAAGSNPATSTRVKPLDFQGFFYLDRYAVLTFEGSFLLRIGFLSQMCHNAPVQTARNPLILLGLRVFALSQRYHKRGGKRLIWGHLSEQQGTHSPLSLPEGVNCICRRSDPLHSYDADAKSNLQNRAGSCVGSVLQSRRPPCAMQRDW